MNRKPAPAGQPAAPVFAIFLGFAMALLVPFHALRADDEALPAAWAEDLDFLVETLRETHPLPFARMEEKEFRARVEETEGKIKTASENERVVALMSLAAALQDGHTALDPTGYGDFNRWYPVRFYEFSDGLFITAIAKPLRDYASAKVLEIGGKNALAAARQAAALWGTENEFGRKEHIFLLSNAGVLETLGIVPEGGGLQLLVQTGEGEPRAITLGPHQGNRRFDWRFYGEMFGPQTEEPVSYATAFEGREPMAFLDNDPDLPLHLRQRRAYFFEWLPEQSTVYFQFNSVARTYRGTSFVEETERLFDLFDESGAGKLVIDIRYNSGGDGSILLPFVHEIIRREKLMTPGHLFVLTGRKTFSAAILLVGHLLRHTPAIFVGEPPGAFINHFGNAESYTLPNSRLRLSVSAVYHQYTWWSEDPGRDLGVFAVDFPVFMASGDYFSGNDPALDLVLSDGDLRPLSTILTKRGSAAARAIYAARRQNFGALTWWKPLREEQIIDAAYELLAAGRIEDAITGFELNAETNPDSWNAWDSLGEAYLAAGRKAEAAEAYAKSLSLNPGNHNAEMMLEHIKHEGE